MSTLMLISNPVKKGSKKMATRRKPRTAAQKRATAKLVASNRKRRSAGSSPAAPARRRRRTSVRTAAKRTYHRARRAAGSAIRRHRRSHASAHRAGFGIVHLLKQAGAGAVGALAVDLVYSKLPIPVSMKSGNVGAVVKAGVTIGLGVLAGKMVNRQLAHGATVGALTVQLHEVLKNFAGGFGLNGYTDINGMGYYTPSGIVETGTPQLGEYMSGVGQDDVYSSPYETVY